MLVMAELKTPPSYEIIIEPSRGWIKVKWDELWEYRDLLYLLVQRDFISRYKQTLLGPLWHIAQPVIQTMVFAIIFSRIAGIPTDGIPAPLFYLCGLLGWSYFAQNITVGGATFINNAHLFGKVYFPRLVVPISVVVANLIAFALQLIPFASFFAYYKLTGDHAPSVQLSWWLLLTPLPLLHIAILSLGVSLLMSASTAKYRDLVHLNQFIIQLWMFATPIIYPVSKIPEEWRWLVWANPMSVPIEAFRVLLLGHGSLQLTDVFISVAISLVVLFAGVAAFQKVERTVIDSV
jgi:lipopolysaccharide transport system permease protein